MIEYSSDDLIKAFLDRSGLNRFLDEVEAANQKFNLFSRNLNRSGLEILVAESLIPLHQGWIGGDSGAILDIGSGWGIPAVPLLLSGLKNEITLLERSQKKADFLYLLLHRLNLIANVTCEDLNNHHEERKYAIAFLRGVAFNSRIGRGLEKLIIPGGSIIYFGSNFPEQWLAQAEVLDYSIDNLPARKLINYPIR